MGIEGLLDKRLLGRVQGAHNHLRGWKSVEEDFLLRLQKEGLRFYEMSGAVRNAIVQEYQEWHYVSNVNFVIDDCSESVDPFSFVQGFENVTKNEFGDPQVLIEGLEVNLTTFSRRIREGRSLNLAGVFSSYDLNLAQVAFWHNPVLHQGPIGKLFIGEAANKGIKTMTIAILLENMRDKEKSRPYAAIAKALNLEYDFNHDLNDTSRKFSLHPDTKEFIRLHTQEEEARIGQYADRKRYSPERRLYLRDRLEELSGLRLDALTAEQLDRTG